MADIKLFLNILEKISLGIWGLTILDLTHIFNNKLFDLTLNNVDDKIKIGTAILGALYLAISLPFKVNALIHKRNMNLIEKEIKKQELEKITRENDNFN